MSGHHSIPLSKRVLCSDSAVAVEDAQKQPCRPQHFKEWSEENMSRAVSAVLVSGISIRKAALMYDIPKSTLGDRISGRVLEGNQSGPMRYLSIEEEEELVSFIEGCAKIGYAKTVKEILALVKRVLASRGVYKEVSYR